MDLNLGIRICSQIWQHTSTIPAFERQTEEDLKLESSLGYEAIDPLSKNNKNLYAYPLTISKRQEQLNCNEPAYFWKCSFE